ncbi:MAG: sterol desaturase family protein [Saprospiraceae bacterium]|nr:sterol desaturase family protein [Saprospiraceae bacterium]
MFDPTDFSSLRWMLTPLLIFGRYAVLSGALFLVFYVWKRRGWLYRKIQQRFPADRDYRREIGYSFLTACIFGAIAWLFLGTPLRQYTQFYTNIEEYGIGWLLLSIPLSLLIHDAYFYWMHRLMHHPRIYRRVHLVHHRSVNPSPWAAYAFHPSEAVLEGGILPLLLVLMPMHPISFFAFITLMLWFNVYGHLGYEIFPKSLYRHPLGRWLNSSIYHNQHHERFTGNFGLYFTIWDRLMGTLRTDSADKVDEVHERIKANQHVVKNLQNRTTMSSSQKGTLASLVLFLLALPGLSAQSINWATDIAPLLYDHCVKCHRDGGIAGFSLIGYDNAVNYKEAIADATAAKRMPPWKADPDYRRFAHENTLTDAEIQRIQDWVATGAPSGNLAAAPPDPVFTVGSEIGMPDHILQTPFYTITSPVDEYRCFVVPNGLAQTAFLRGMEVIPSDHQAIHHVLVFEDTTGQAKLNDLATPEPGYAQFGGIGVQGARLVGAWVPGSRNTLLPPFMGMKLTPGADLVLQIHYPGNAQGLTANATVNLFFTPTNQGIREVSIAPFINHFPPSLSDYPLSIPPNQVKTYHAQFTVPTNASLIGIGPHMHLIGQSIECFARTLQGDTIPLIRIPDWDFHWQGSYLFQQVQKMPIGAKVHAYAVYDNTLNNDQNPSDPPQWVNQGEATTDEMMLIYFTYMLYQPGDENIVLDSTLLSSGTAAPDPRLGALRVSPNPASERIQVQFDLLEAADFQASILDLNGRTLKIFALQSDAAPGAQQLEAMIGDLMPGHYLVQIQAAGGTPRVARFVKTEP